jgi:hypothetical protein
MWSNNRRGAETAGQGGLPFLRRFLRRAHFFLLFFCFLCLFLYAAGTVQRFTGENQLFLLRLSLMTGLLLGFCSLCEMVCQIRSIVLFPLPGKFLSLPRLLFGAAFGAGAAIFASFIITAAGGNMP